MKGQIKAEAETIFPKLVEIRRRIHQNPELSFEEYQTSALIKNKLRELGLEVVTDIAGTGVVGILRGKTQGKVLALRADMDALPLQELSEVPYRSRINSRMHACGHDAHVAALLGGAMILSKFKDKLKGTVKFIFQPGEEKSPGGARLMVEQGVLENPKVEVIFGLHSNPEIPVGKFSICPGRAYAQPDELRIQIIGKGGHAASPHQTIDPIIIAAQVVMAFQTIPSRLAPPLDAIVVTIGKISGGTTTNIIPDKVELQGTVRTLKPELATKARQWIEQILDRITSMYGAKYELDYKEGYPAVINDESLSLLVKSCITDYLGEDRVVNLPPSMGGEDFSYYQQKVKGVIFYAGVGNSRKGITHPLHSPFFDIDETMLKIASGLWAKLAFDYFDRYGNE